MRDSGSLRVLLSNSTFKLIHFLNMLHILFIVIYCFVFIKIFSSHDDSKLLTGLHSPSHTHIHTELLLAALCCSEGQVRVQHLAQGHLGMQMGKTGDRP